MEPYVQPLFQPFAKLTQANMTLMTRFALSPEVTSEWNTQFQKFYEDTQESASRLMQSQAFARLVSGMMENYLQFVMDLTQGGLSAAGQAQNALWQKAQEVSGQAREAARTSASRMRQAA